MWLIFKGIGKIKSPLDKNEVRIMMNLNAVSETALLTLKARVLEVEKQSPVIHDAKGREILDKISSHVSTETQRRALNRKLPSTLTSYLALIEGKKIWALTQKQS